MKNFIFFIFLFTAQMITVSSPAQNCPVSATILLTSNPSTYYPGVDANVNIGAKSITLGAAGYGTTPINTGELLLVIQMQGAQINSSNTSSYGDGMAGGMSGYLNNSALKAGTMEYIVATNTVPLSGGTLTLLTGTVNAYKNQAFAVDGQYRFQVIRVGLYYNLILGAAITAPAWNGSTGGVIVLSATNNLNFNGRTVSAAGLGFRGGAARQLPGGNGGANSDIVSLSTKNYHASKGEGIAGTPRFVNNQGIIVDNGSANEGYPNGSYAMGAPGNAGGGGTDGNPSANDQNSGGGGGANGGTGGRGGNSWSSNLAVGGAGAANFAQFSPSRLVMGGGGGAGTTNNGTGSLSAGFSTSGAIGGGIVLVTANSITGTGIIDASGENAFITVLNDGSGGGGAGGSILLYAGSGTSNITAIANGGTGGTNTGIGSPHGPGGGGGGGVIFSNGPLNAASSVSPGIAGTTSFGATNYNAAAGNIGVMVKTITKSQVPNQFLYCSLLPVNFIAVDALQKQNEVLLNWTVSNASEVKYFTVEKSDDGSSFSVIGSVSNAHAYTDTKNNSEGIVYYRIKETEHSGAYNYSQVISVRSKQQLDGGLSTSPNPARNGDADIRFVTKKPGATARISIIAFSGAVVWQQQYQLKMGMNTVHVENLLSIPNGTYMVQVNDGQGVMVTKIIIQH